MFDLRSVYCADHTLWSANDDRRLVDQVLVLLLLYFYHAVAAF